MDREYPFNPPQIFYNINPNKSEYGYCKDLLNHILKNQLWGPSLTLPTFLEKLPMLAVNFFVNLEQFNKKIKNSLDLSYTILIWSLIVKKTWCKTLLNLRI